MITQKTYVLVADDHNIVRRGLVSLLSLIPEIEVVGEAADGRSAVSQTLEKKPDVVLMDISMPILNGLEATKQIKNEDSNVKVLILSAYDNESYVLESIRSGANGYLLKNSSWEDLNTAIKAVMSGQAFFSPGVSKIIADSYVKGITPGGREEHPPANGSSRLTQREREILQLVAEGKTHQQIAEILHISVRTVDTHRNNIIQKLDLHDTASLVTYAIKNGIVILQK
jgi:DNA-binding NarL/FixJ family response regulator